MQETVSDEARRDQWGVLHQESTPHTVRIMSVFNYFNKVIFVLSSER